MEFLEFKDLLFEKAKKQGFSEYEVYYSNKEESSINVSDEEVEGCSISSSRGAFFRGMIRGKLGYGYTEKFDEDSIDVLLKNVRECAEFAENDKDEIIFRGSDEYIDVAIFDEKVNTLTMEEQVNMAINLEKRVKEISNEIERVAGSVFRCCKEEISIINSKGLNLHSKQSILSCGVVPIAKEENNMITDSEDVRSIFLSDINIDRIAHNAVNRVLSKKQATSIRSGRYRVLMSNEVMGYFLNVMKSNFYGDLAEDGKSLFKDFKGRSVAAPILDIMDNPILGKGLATRSFDDEGVPTKPKYLIKNGVFLGFLHNLKSSKKQGVKTTGNGFKGNFSSPIKVSATNLYIEPKNVSFQSLLNSMEFGIYITDLEGIHSGADPITGDFSLSAQGRIIENGIFTRPIKQITIAGNFLEVLRDIEIVGDDLKFNPYTIGVGSPSVIVRELSIAGEN